MLDSKGAGVQELFKLLRAVGEVGGIIARKALEEGEGKQRNSNPSNQKAERKVRSLSVHLLYGVYATLIIL